MESETTNAAPVLASAAHFLPIWLSESVEFLRNLALVAIPFVLWYASRAVEKRRATLNLIRSLDSEISENLQRLFLFRKFEERSAAHPSRKTNNPYDNLWALFYLDSVFVLNYYEAICTEIEEGALDGQLLYKTCRNSIIGVAEVVLGRYNEKVGSDQSGNYQKLVNLSQRWRKQAAPRRDLGATFIPGD